MRTLQIWHRILITACQMFAFSYQAVFLGYSPRMCTLLSNSCNIEFFRVYLQPMEKSGNTENSGLDLNCVYTSVVFCTLFFNNRLLTCCYKISPAKSICFSQARIFVLTWGNSLGVCQLMLLSMGKQSGCMFCYIFDILEFYNSTCPLGCIMDRTGSLSVQIQIEIKYYCYFLIVGEYLLKLLGNLKY